MNSAIRARREAEDGFTLIELLVVVIIIGILAAIAIPAFLNQRERAWQAELTSAVRNTALEIEAEATQNGGAYPSTTDGQALSLGFVNDETGSGAAAGTFGDPISVVSYESNVADVAATGTGFTLCMSHFSIDPDGNPATADNNVTYQGGAVGNGVQDFAEAAC